MPPSTCTGSNCSPGTYDPPVACRTDHCGDARFLKAVPTRATVGIRFGTSGSGALTASRRALAAISPAFVSVDEYVEGINDDVEYVFSEIEDLAGSAPDMESDDEHEWRSTEGGLEELLDITTDDFQTFELVYALGPAGFEPTDENTIMSGEVTVGADGEKDAFDLKIDLGRWNTLDPSADVQGLFRIRAQPFGGGLWEIWYDLEEVAAGDEPPVTSLTTVWVFDPDSAALEYLAATDQAEATAYARWDETGGRLDHHAAFGDGDELVSNCWDETGAELFSAQGVFQNGAWDVALDGAEEDCVFGPAADYPGESGAFVLLPEEGSWDDLDTDPADTCDLATDPLAPECPPLCEDAPDEPECTQFCDVDPNAPNCIWYCEWFDDPTQCG